MSNIVYLSGPMRIGEIRNVPDLGMLMEVTIFNYEDVHQNYPVFLTGKQIEVVTDKNQEDSGEFPLLLIGL